MYILMLSVLHVHFTICISSKYFTVIEIADVFSVTCISTHTIRILLHIFRKSISTLKHLDTHFKRKKKNEAQNLYCIKF